MVFCIDFLRISSLSLASVLTVADWIRPIRPDVIGNFFNLSLKVYIVSNVLFEKATVARAIKYLFQCLGVKRIDIKGEDKP